MFDRDFVLQVVEAEDADVSGVLGAHAEDEVERGRLAGAVGADKAVDRAWGERQVERSHANAPYRFFDLWISRAAGMRAASFAWNQGVQ